MTDAIFIWLQGRILYIMRFDSVCYDQYINQWHFIFYAHHSFLSTLLIIIFFSSRIMRIIYRMRTYGNGRGIFIILTYVKPVKGVSHSEQISLRVTRSN